jgi:hypothetical protein
MLKNMTLKNKCAGFELLVAVAMTSITFWDVTPCSPVEVKTKLSKQQARWRQQKSSEMRDAKIVIFM